MLVVQIGHVLVIVLQRVMMMGVGVLAEERRIVDVLVMSVVVAVGVLVIDRFVAVNVAVALGQV